jgi:hypothetical protein
MVTRNVKGEVIQVKRQILVGGFAACFFLTLQMGEVFGHCLVAGQGSGSQVSRQFSVSPGQQVTFDIQTGGSISVTGSDSNIVSVKATLGGRDAADCQVDMSQNGSGVEIKSTYTGSHSNYSSNIRFEVQAPRQFNVSISSAGGGITIDGVEGALEGSTGGGAILISNAKGTVALTTGGGGITVKDSALDGTVSTGGGHVMIQGNTGNLKGSTGGGRVVYKDSSGATTSSSDDGENITAKSAGGKEARIHRGGGEINLNDVPNGADIATGGGDIHIASGRGRVRATTGGGNIEIGPTDGSIDAMTGGGNVTAAVIGLTAGMTHNVRIASGSGDVTITLPPGISAQFDIKLAYTHSSKQNYQIISDFGITQTASDTWSSAEGTPRKYIYGAGTIGSGENRITVRTVNGNVYIRRGPQ